MVFLLFSIISGASYKVIQNIAWNLACEELSPRRLLPGHKLASSLFHPNLLICVRTCATPDLIPSNLLFCVRTWAMRFPTYLIIPGGQQVSKSQTGWGNIPGLC